MSRAAGGSPEPMPNDEQSDRGEKRMRSGRPDMVTAWSDPSADTEPRSMVRGGSANGIFRLRAANGQGNDLLVCSFSLGDLQIIATSSDGSSKTAMS